MIHKGILQGTELRLVVRPYLQITTTSLVGLGLLGGWAGPNWPMVLTIAAVLIATIVWIGRRARLRGAKPVYIYASAVINLVASAVIVLITGGARSPFWLLFLVGAIASAMSFRGRTGSNLDRVNAAIAAVALLGPELIDWPLDWPMLALAGMEVLTLFMSGGMIRKITSLILESGETLRESEERYRLLIDTARDVIFSLTTDGTFTSLNPSFETFTGWSRDEWLGRPFTGLIAEADLPRALDLFQRVLRGETLRAIRLRVHTRAGETLVIELNMSPQIKDGRPVGLLGIARDMTEEQRAEDALKASEQRFRALIENSSDAVALLSADGAILYASPATTRVLGYTADEWVGRNVFELLHPDDRPSITALFAQLLQSPKAMVTTQTRYWHKAGEWRWYEGTGHNLLAELSVQAIVLNYRDITERKQAEENLRCRAEELSALYHITYDLTVQADVNSLLQTIAQRASALLGLTESGIFLFDPVRKDVEIVASTNDIAPIGLRLNLGEGMAGRVAESRQPMIVEDYSHWEGRSEQLKDAPFASDLQVPMLYQGELIGVLDVYDIHRADEPPDALKRKFTEADANLLSLFASAAAGAVYSARLHQQVQRYAEELEQRVAERTRELAQANERLTELDALKTKFVSDVSHELRTPVTNLGLYLNLLERGKPEKRAQYMSVLQEQTIRLTQLIEDILDLSRLERDRERLVFEPVNLNALADRVVTAQLPRAETAGLRLTFDPDLDLPPVRGETSQLAQVITNLVTNAINYTQSGSVQVSTRCAGERVCVAVQDTGLGIDANDLAHIFERFYRGQRVTKLHIPGTGLGLGIVKEIVAVHSGTVEVESRVGEGSTFRVWLPAGSSD